MTQTHSNVNLIVYHHFLLLRYAPLLLVIDFSLLFLSLFFAMAMSVTINIANILSLNLNCDNSDTGSGGGCVVMSVMLFVVFTLCFVVRRCAAMFTDAMVSLGRHLL